MDEDVVGAYDKAREDVDDVIDKGQQLIESVGLTKFYDLLFAVQSLI